MLTLSFTIGLVYSKSGLEMPAENWKGIEYKEKWIGNNPDEALGCSEFGSYKLNTNLVPGMQNVRWFDAKQIVTCQETETVEKSRTQEKHQVNFLSDNLVKDSITKNKVSLSKSHWFE